MTEIPDDKIEKEENESKQIHNCYILIGPNIKELKLTQKSVGTKENTAFDSDWGWCFKNEKDAEVVAKKYSLNGNEFKVLPFFSERARKKWYGTKLEKRFIALEGKYLIKKKSIEKKENDIRRECDKHRFDFSFLYENTTHDSLDNQQQKIFKILKPQFDDLKKEQVLCDELQQELIDLELQIIQKNHKIRITPKDWPFKVLGFNNKREILLWHQGALMYISAKFLCKRDLQLLMGTQMEVNPEEIIEEAHNKGKIYDDKPLKSGVWKLKGKWLIISGKNAAVIGLNGLKLLEDPVFEGRIIKLEDKDWINWDHFCSIFGKVNLSQVYSDVLNKISSWNWAHLSMADYVTAFVFLSPFQQAMNWRPWLHLTGARSTGKSSFFDYILLGIFSSLIQRLDKSTAHAVAQSIGNTCKISIFDEFEKNKHIIEIMELTKLSNAGGVKTSGTPGEKLLEYELHHIHWFGSIYLPKHISCDSAQESRIVKLELKKLNNSVPLLNKIDSEQGLKISAEIVAAMLFQWPAIEMNANAIAARRNEIMQRIPGTQIRTVDNFMYASAVINNALNVNYSVPEWVSTSSEDDGEKILNFILSSLIRMNLEEFSVGLCIENARGEQGGYFCKALENVGIKHTSHNGMNYIALRAPLIVRFLLSDTDYKDMDIQAPLSRIEGAISSQPVKFLKQSQRCILVPLALILGEASDECNLGN